MDNIKQFKMFHQYQFGFVSSNDKYDQDIYAYVKKFNEEQNNEENNFIIEKYPEVVIENDSYLDQVFSEINSSIFEEGQCTHLQLLIKNDYEGLARGSYYINYPKAFSTGYYDNEISDFFDEDESALVLVCTNLQLINNLGRSGYVKALKQAGEIRQIFKRSRSSKLDVKNNINFNALSHAAGLNINSLLVIDVFAI